MKMKIEEATMCTGLLWVINAHWFMNIKEVKKRNYIKIVAHNNIVPCNVMRPAIKSAFTFLLPLLSILYEGEFWTLLGKSFCCLNLMEEMHHNSIPVKCSALHISRSECCYAMRLNIVPSSSSIWSPYETNGTLTSSSSGTRSALNYVKGGWANKLENHFF